MTTEQAFSRIIIDRHTPHIRSQKCDAEPGELTRETVFVHDEPVGHVVYVTRKVPEGTLYGWQPAGRSRKLTTKKEAVMRLLHPQGRATEPS